ncbi:hypothetical protein AJ79_04331 [Helicocarpus griseus UAMH5409]|uniref:Uncharacterized protein n=1 Tax=Helicocarpus griseus UAMH5409 TaxID=1447875 RepID=A0A2B7XUE5_9EURO|nr:hypothetical protein AJ79_04331 [Helicocarpus griseus UAMH5409]
MTGKLTLHKSPKRKRDELDYHQPRTRVSTSPASSSQTTVSVRDRHLVDDQSPAIGENNSPQISVAGELDELDLHGDSGRGLQGASHGLENDKKADNGKSDEKPSAISPAGKGKWKKHRASPPGSPRRQKSRSRRKSPPLSSDVEENPLTWHDSEITGYAPTDPNDDGYGINGIGFKPTAAVAWDRSQRRKKQVAEWKSREAKEARERRKSRRDGIIPVDENAEDGPSPKSKRVKFDIGKED